MEEFELDYDVQEVRLSEKHMFKVTTIANEALPLEMLLDLETRRCFCFTGVYNRFVIQQYL